MLSFIDRLHQGSLLADGAMGTMLHQSGTHMDSCFDALNLSDPERVLAVHPDFLKAGAELIETNTFCANRFKLALHKLAGDVTAINRAAVEIARRAISAHGDTASGKTIYLAGAVGPL